MKPSRFTWVSRVFVALMGAATCISSADAQRNPSGMPQPRLYQVNPPGAKAGGSLEVVIAGLHLEEPERLVFSDPGIKAEFMPPPAPEIDPKTKKPKPVANALPADHFKFRVTVPPTAKLGNHDVRVVSKWGVSNPRVFVVGDLPEVTEKEPNNEVDQATKVDLNTTINGTLGSPTDVDYFAVPVKKGQRVVVSCQSGSIDGRAMPQVEVYDGKDRQVASNRSYSGSDAVTDFIASEDGTYTVRLIQFTHIFRAAISGGMPGGASDTFYRLSISTKPWIDSVHPAVVEAGKTTMVTVLGRNLPGGQLEPMATVDESTLEKITMPVTVPPEARGKLNFSGYVPPNMGWEDGLELRVKNASGSSNPFLVGLARVPLLTDNDKNDTPELAQEIPLPCEVAGRVERRRDRDWYVFTARKGETWNLEVVSNRLGAPTFMTMLLRNPTTKADIHESPLNEPQNVYFNLFFSRSEDPPLYRFTAPADGKYQLLVASRAGDSLFGARHTYTLRITKDEPDYRLVVVPRMAPSPRAGLVGAGGDEALAVLVERRDNFDGDIELTVDGLPGGVTCKPQTLSGAARMTTLVISAGAGAAPWSGEIRVKGTATIGGNKVTREARPAGVVWPIQPNQNAPTMSRLEQGLWLAVRGKAPFAMVPSIDKAEILQGGKGNAKVKIQRNLPEIKNPVAVTLMQTPNRPGIELPNNLRFNNNQPVNIAANQAEVAVPVTVGNDVPPGTYQVVFRGETQIPYNKDPKNNQKPNTFTVQPSQPLVVTVLPKSLAQLSLSTTSANVKAGGQTEVVVRVQRQFNYQGEFKVKLELPAQTTGITIADVTIPAGQNEAKLLVKAAADAKPGARNNLLVKATALYQGKTPTLHETKFNINVTK